jgi:hypothetical protein
MSKDDLKRYKSEWYQKNKERLYAKSQSEEFKRKKQIADKKYRLKNIEKLKIQKKQYSEKNKEKLNAYKKKWAKNNEQKVISARQKWSENNPNYKHPPVKSWSKERKEKLLKKMALYCKERRKTDPIFKLKSCLRVRIRKFIISKNKKSLSTINIIGIDYNGVKKHIERQFKKGMTWENHGTGTGKWHIDHIIPLSTAKTEEEVVRLCHYTNLQPLWEEENLKKQNKIPQVQIKIPI